MNELVKVYQIMFGEDKINATDGRELYKKLGLAKDQYKRWIENYVNNYDFEEGFDYLIVDKNTDINVGINLHGNTKNDYIISSDMAKEICMMTNNDIGSKIRKYYIALERKQCDTSKNQLYMAHNEIKQLQVKRLKTYSHGFISLRKYLKDNDINLTEETAWSMLLQCNAVEKRDTLVSKTFLLDDTFGKQIGDSVIEFNSRALDDVFSNYVNVEPSLFEEG